MFTVILFNKSVFVVSNNGTLVSAASYLKRERAIDSYMNTSSYLDDNNLLSNDSCIIN